MTRSLFPHPLQHLIPYVSLICSHSDEGKLNSQIIKMCIFMIAKDGEHFMNTYWSFAFILLRTVLFIIPFIDWKFGVFNFVAVLYTFYILPSKSGISHKDFFSHSVVCVYVLC